MNVKYSPDFKKAYEKLPLSIQQQFQAVDAAVMRGDLPKERMGWAYFADISDHYVAMGSLRERDVFYWILITSPEAKPVIL